MILRALAVAVVACGCVSETMTCEQNPETQRAALRAGGGWDANGTSLNGVWQNGIWENGVWSNGIMLNGVDLGSVGAGSRLPIESSDGRRAELTVTAVETDADLVFYRVELDGVNPCGGDGRGLFVAGTWDASGARHEGRLTFSCTNGAIAKCVMMGYAPETAGAAQHQACTRMVRADYCGDGVSHTRDGTLIDVYDTAGVMAPGLDRTFRFEAAWGPNGALCVERTRFDTWNESGDIVLPSCWQNLPRCDSWAAAQQQGATLGVSSRLQSRTICN